MTKPPEVRVLDSLIKHMARVEADPLTPLIDRYYMERHRSARRLRKFNVDMLDRPRPAGRLSPSKICGCERQAAFVFVGMPGRGIKDPEQEAVFEDGKWRHLKWDAIFLDMQLVLGSKKFAVVSIEEYVEVPKLFIAGHLDAVIKINGEKWVVDFKGINSWGFERVFREHEPHEAHVLQLICYMRARRIPRGMILYDHKDKNLTKIFAVRFTQAQWSEVNEWCERVLRKLVKEDLPPMSLDCQSGNFLFEKCPFSYVCYGRKSHEQIRRRMYRDFDSIEGMWERGREAIMAASSIPDDI